jgi:hypothetical protein
MMSSDNRSGKRAGPVDLIGRIRTMAPIGTRYHVVHSKEHHGLGIPDESYATRDDAIAAVASIVEDWEDTISQTSGILDADVQKIEVSHDGTYARLTRPHVPYDLAEFASVEVCPYGPDCEVCQDAYADEQG